VAAQLRRDLEFLGFDIDSFVPEASADNIDEDRREEIQRLVSARTAARRAKNWRESDRLRDKLAALGVAINDNKDGTTTWELKS
jgi:cysteinyl-tRNA synthetase